MAFVNRSEKKADYLSSGNQETVGPGSYVAHSEYKQPKSFAPFNSSRARDSEFKEKDILPGPGQYFTNQNNLNEKIVVSSQNEDIKIVEIPKPQSIFKSGTKRFQEEHPITETPGVGSYEIKTNIVNQQYQSQVQSQKKDIIDTLMKINKYQSIPSIPSNLHSYGYTENEHNDLELNKIPQIQHSGIKQDRIGPGQYNLKDSIEFSKYKGSQWHKYQAREMKIKDKLNGIGPGQYDPNVKYVPIYKLKPSPGFASKSLRYSEQRKGMISQKALKSASLRSLSTGQGLSNQEDISDSEYEFIEDTVPAPGFYHNYSTMSSLKIQQKPEKFQFFGSSADRFGKTDKGSGVGPTDYQSSSSFGKNLHAFKVRNPPFLSSNTRFETRNIIDQKPGPGQYVQSNNLEDKLIRKIKKGYKGNFGTTEKRFKNTNVVDDMPGPGQYIEPIIETEEDEAQNAVFKSAQKRDIFQKQKDLKPPVGSYQIDHYDIQKNVFKEQEEEDEDLMIKRPGFNSSEPRFPQPKIEPVNEDDEIVSPQTKGKTLEMLNQKPKQLPPFNQKAQRFNYEAQQKQAKNPGPGQYHDPNNNLWNKRTYNILFAEI